MAKLSKHDKALALVEGGCVKPYKLAHPPLRGIAAKVRGESGEYDVHVWIAASGRIERRCTCEYASVHPVRQDCSHTEAVSWLL